MQRGFVPLANADGPVGLDLLDQQQFKAFAATARTTKCHGPVFVILSGQDQVAPGYFLGGGIGLYDGDASRGQQIFLQI